MKDKTKLRIQDSPQSTIDDLVRIAEPSQFSRLIFSPDLVVDRQLQLVLDPKLYLPIHQVAFTTNTFSG